MKSPLLLLVHRIPFPPNKGDKIRSFNLLKHLAESYQIYLGAFVDDSNDWQYKKALHPYCTEIKLLAQNKKLCTLKSAIGLLTGDPLTLPYYANAEMQRWVNQVMMRCGGQLKVVTFSSPMAQFVDTPAYDSIHKIADFVDVDSDKWLQYSNKKSWPMDWVYQREAKLLEQYERKIAVKFQKTYLVSETEARLMRELAPEAANKIEAYDNGVDSEFFDPTLSYDSPYEDSRPVIVFTGAMDYFANEDAVVWFADNVLPIIHQQQPDVHFVIVGSKPTPAVKALGNRDNIEVTGRVEDVRPYLAHARCAVAPMQIARGIQNKVLEALAMNKATVCTPAAAEGLTELQQLAPMIHQDAESFAKYTLEVLHSGNASLSPQQSYRDYVLTHYSWQAHLSKVDQGLTITKL